MRKSCVLLACAVGVLAASAFAEEETSKEAKAAKVAKWVGQKVTLLGRAPLTCPKPEKESTPLYYYKEGKSSERISVDRYAGKSATIVGAKMASSYSPEIILELDETHERIATADAGVLGFHSELEAAKKWAGKSLWSKGQIWLSPMGSECERSIDDRIVAKNLQHLTITRAEPGMEGHRVHFLVKTDSGKEGWIGGWTSHVDVDEALALSPKPIGEQFLLEDPRKKHATWKAGIWQLIEEGQVAIGMTEEMATLACGERMPKTGFVVSGDQEIGTIYACNGKQFLVDKGKVTRYIENR